MHWYGGSIAEAVALSKQRNAIFVVFVEGDNDLSTEMSATIDNEAVVRRLSDPSNFLAVKLKSGTTNYTHFAQIYQFVPVPSLFFIGRNGTPLEVVCAGVESTNLATRIDRILAEHHTDKPAAMQPSTSSENVKQQTANLLQAEATAGAAPPKVDPSAPKVDSPAPKVDPPAPKVDTPAPKVDSTAPKVDPPAPAKVESEPSPPRAKIQKTEDVKQSPEMEIVCDGDVCVRRPKQGASEPGASTSSQGQGNKPEPTAVTTASEQPISESAEQETTSTISAEEKIERVKELLEAKRRENAEKEKELERQKELERRTAGQGVAELKRWQADQELKQIQEERKREKKENNLVRQRILEQIAQDRAERRARDPLPPAAAPAQPHQQTAPPVTSGDAHSSARIQFKLPDGTSHTASFDADGTLRRVQLYVADNLQLSTSNFSLWTAFPRRELVETECTLRELQLAPSAALLVLPRRAANSPPQAASFSVLSFISQLLTSLIYEPTLQIYSWLRTRLFPPPAVSPRAPSPPRPPTAAPPLRRRGNIHRLPGDAPDDDNNTWNGNSTQQM